MHINLKEKVLQNIHRAIPFYNKLNSERKEIKSRSFTHLNTDVLTS